MTKIKIKIKKIPAEKKKIVIAEIVLDSNVKKFGKLFNHKTRVFLARLLVKPITWLYTEVMEEL